MGLWKTFYLPLALAALLGATNAAITLAEPVDVPRTYMVEFVDDYVLRPLLLLYFWDKATYWL